ncbi:CidA/LrgA family protein [Microbulbifer hydrolyticus]|uniref:CidA/LrgA family protein n=1 Tax=Microbulbifer hydrolyticus TaxID=48074 RepID=A0A6P1T7G5_9GAMM|nr:CidA/LrgA family protein [Microbulbifer hydrolyticus]MBB5211632.1 holin-like protein [Microbulbifer hydrolyticus]QHQ37633.1 CidA/LrgA family protein [Microbulbifer hydrolyticus]
MATLRNLPRWLLGAGLLLAFDLAGRSLSAAFSLPVPGPVLGMLLLLLALMIYGRVPRGLAEVGGQVLRLLILIFLPATVGIYFLRDLSGGDWAALAIAMFFGTLISFTLTALVLNRLIQRTAARQRREQDVE